ENIKTNCGVDSVTRFANSVVVVDSHGVEHSFDHIVFASHADQTLEMLSDASAQEQRLLGAFKYEQNRAILHRDERLMPKLGEVWSSWNHLAGKQDKQQKISVSYWMNSLQHLPCQESILVTLNPLREPR